MRKPITHQGPSPYGLQIPDNCVTCGLRSAQFFCSLPVPALRDFEKLRASALLPKNAVLFVEGEAPRGMYILCQGTVKLSTVTEHGKTVILKIAEAGETLGLSACVSGRPYGLTAETRTPCQTSFVKRHDLIAFLRRYGAACLQAATHLSTRRKDALDAMCYIAEDHVTNEKFAKFLLAQDTQRLNLITVAMTHEEIAEVIGMARESVTRAFTDFKHAGWITVKGKNISICDRGALEQLMAT